MTRAELYNLFGCVCILASGTFMFDGDVAASVSMAVAGACVGLSNLFAIRVLHA